MPAVAFKVLELCRLDDVNIQDVANTIAKDPALTAKLMRVSNSSIFGMSKKVASIQQAMVVLGLRTVKIMALGFSLVDSLGKGSKIGFDYPRYWRRSLSTAVAARQLAEALGTIRKDEAFVGGLLCDIGMVAAERHPGGIYEQILVQHQLRGGKIQDIEREYLDITHAEISAMMLANWSMPETLCHAVGAHHGDGFEEIVLRTKSVACVLRAASEIAELFCGDVCASECLPVKERVIDITGIAPQILESVLEVLNDNVEEAADLFSLELSEGLDYDALRTGAVMHLANLSMSLERDRMDAESQAQKAKSQVQTLSRLNETLAEEAKTDKLTGIANRRAFDQWLEEAVSVNNAKNGNLGLILIDLDYFKKINDTYGHLAGDEALRLVGRCLKDVVENGSYAARYGGEEFVIAVADTTARNLRGLAEDIRKSIGNIRFKHGRKELSLTASLGAVHVSFGEETVEAREILRRADECLYDAKADGRNRVEITF